MFFKRQLVTKGTIVVARESENSYLISYAFNKHGTCMGLTIGKDEAQHSELLKNAVLHQATVKTDKIGRVMEAYIDGIQVLDRTEPQSKPKGPMGLVRRLLTPTR